MEDATQPPCRPPVIVGIALKREKRRKHISDRLVAEAAEAGVELRFVEKDVPLEQQGPFHAILQKVRKPGERRRRRRRRRRRQALLDPGLPAAARSN